MDILLIIIYFGIGVAIAGIVEEINDGKTSGFVFGMCVFLWPIVIIGVLLFGFLLLFVGIGTKIGEFIKKILEK